MTRILPGLALLAAISTILVAGALLDDYWRIALVELLLVALLSLVPGWLYLEFLVHRGQAVYDEYVLNLFRLHIDEYRNLPAPPEHTSYYRLWKSEHDQLGTTTTDNLYRAKFESVFGPSSVSTRALFSQRETWHDVVRTFGPVVLATVVLCLGWTLTFQPELVRVVAGADQVAGRPPVPTSALQYGFLGAYVFILQDLVRRYFRDDLKPGAYVSAVVRIIVVAALVTVVHTSWTGLAEVNAEAEAAVAFLIGFFPQSAFRLLQSSLSKPLRKVFPRVEVEHPLHELEGLSVWYEVRFLEEGIE
ncbi:MAG: hypothetical protein R3320_05155, partial [Nitriliruptorales bacterium]|nr:hypothetical protein [Nitriliruptorales bacterium]